MLLTSGHEPLQSIQLNPNTGKKIKLQKLNVPIKLTVACYENLQHNLQHHNVKRENERLHLPVHVDNAVAYSTVCIFYGGASWAEIQRHRFAAETQKQDNGSFFFKTPHHQVQAGQETSILPKAPLLSLPSASIATITDCLFI